MKPIGLNLILCDYRPKRTLAKRRQAGMRMALYFPGYL